MTVNVNTDNETIRLFVVRHGQTNHNIQKILQGHIDTSLNPTGEHQAELVGARFEDFPFDSVYTSDLTRCRKTCDAIISRLKKKDISLTVTDRLRERHMGVIEGKHVDEAIAYAEAEGKHYRDYGEDAKVFIERIASVLNEILMANKNNKNSLLVSHGGTIRSLLKILQYEKDFIVYNTSVTVIDFNRHDFNRFTIRVIGDTAHLGEGDHKVDNRVR